MKNKGLIIIRFLLFGNIYVALGAAFLVQSTRIQLGLGNPLMAYTILVFFATLFIYNLQRIFYKHHTESEFNSVRRKWIFHNQTSVKFLTFIGLMGVFASFFVNDLHIVFYLSPLLLLSLAYFIPAVKLRKSPLFKLFTLVLVWMMVTAAVPILLSDTDPFTKGNLVHIATRFCFMMGICIPFDLRDLKVDAADNVATLPHVIGEKNTERLAWGIMLIYILLIILEYKLGTLNRVVYLLLLFSALINSIVVFMCNSKRSEYFYIALLDGTMIFQGAMLMVAEFLI